MLKDIRKKNNKLFFFKHVGTSNSTLRDNFKKKYIKINYSFFSHKLMLLQLKVFYKSFGNFIQYENNAFF